MSNVRLTFGRGVNKDVLPSELPAGFWSDVLNIRSKNGFEETFEGVISKNTAASLTDDGAAFLFPFAPIAGTASAVYGNRQNISAFSSGVHSSLTPTNRQAAAVSALTRIGANTAQATTAAHGLATGDTIHWIGAVESGYNVVSKPVTVIDATHFQYTTDTAIAANATTVGQYIVVNAATPAAFVRFATYPTGGSLNGVFFLHARLDGIYYWLGNTGVKLTQLPFAVPIINGVNAVRPFKDYLVVIGNQEVYWSNAAEPGTLPTTFAASDTNDAGSVTLAETPGTMIDCLPLGDVNIVYKRDSMYAMQYIGGNDVFSFTRIPGEDGLYAAWCVVNTPKGHVFLTQNLDIKIHQGGYAQSIAEGCVRRWLASNFDISGHSDRIFLTVNPEKAEVWVCFATTSSTKGCDKALVWNWEAPPGEGWGIFDLGTTVGSAGGISFANEGLWPSQITTQSRLVVVDNSFHIDLVDSSASTGVQGTLERVGIDLDDRDTMKYIDSSRLNFKDSVGNGVSVYHGASHTADGAVTYAGPASYTPGTTDMAKLRGKQDRFVALKLVTAAVPGGNKLKLRSADLDVKSGGKR
jgi:hypothetical protein